jgi:nitrogen-specific signal transduction histidine kinase
MVSMDILHLVDRLEELFNESRPFPFTHLIFVDEDRMLDLIDQMRVSIPEEIKKSQQVLVQRDRILAQAQEEANRTINLAREKSEELLNQDPTVQAAQERSELILAKVREEAAQSKRESDDYVLDTLRRLELEMDRIQTQVRNGIQALESEKQPKS